MQQSRIFVGMVLILIFGEVLGLYGYGKLDRRNKTQLTDHRLIVALILNTSTD